MQRKKLIAVGIALALQTYYLPAIAADSSDDDNDCPTDTVSYTHLTLPTICSV